MMFVTNTVLGGAGFSVPSGAKEYLITVIGYPLTLAKTLAKPPEKIIVFGNTGGVGDYDSAKQAYKIPIIIKTPILPSEYTELEYIAGTGTQFINTEFAPNQNTKVEIDFQLLSGTGALFGSREGTNLRGFTVQALSAGWFGGTYGNENRQSTFPYDYLRHIHVLDKNKYYLDGGLGYTYSTATFTCPGNAYIFAMYNNAAPTSGANGRLYQCRIYDNDILIRDLIPAKRNSDDETGLYDTVNNAFYTSVGTDKFIAGGEVLNKTIYLYSDAQLETFVRSLTINIKEQTATRGGTDVSSLQDWTQDFTLPKADNLTVTAGTAVDPARMRIEYWSSERG